MRRKGWPRRLAGILIVGLGALAVLIAVLVGRALMLKPSPLPERQAPAVVAFDLNRAADRLGQAIRFETVSHQDVSLDDAAQWASLRDWMAAAYPAFHAAAQREIVGGGALVWTWPGRNPHLPPIILMAHQDVVPAAPETLGRWKAPPFSGAVRDGAVWGRGAIDDKGSLIALLEAGEALAASGRQPERTIIVVSGHDEETRGGGAQAAAELLKSRGVHAWFVLDEGSAIIDDHPAIGGPAALIAVAEKGYVTLRITARGAGGHASAPPRETAVSVLARAVTAIEGKAWPLRYDGPTRDGLRVLAPYAPFSTRLLLANDWLFGGLLARQMAGSPAAAAGLHTTIAPTMLSGSPKENVLPETASAWINYRLAPGTTVQDVVDRARIATRGLPVEVAMVGQGREPTPVSSHQSEAYRYVASALAQEAPSVPVAPSLMIAASDARYLTPVAQDVYRFTPNRFRMGDLGMVHGVDEHMTLGNLERNIRFYARLMIGD